MNLHVVLRIHAAKVDTEEAGVEARSVAVTHIANTRLCLTEKIYTYIHRTGTHDTTQTID